MSDLFGYEPPSTFKDIRNTRPSKAEEKATLLLQLGRLIGRCPPSVASGSINAVRAWKEAQEAAKKIAKNSRSSAHQIQSAITNMQRWS